METKKKQRMNLGLMALMGLVGILAVGTMAARASVLSDIPDGLNTALLGGTSLYAAKAILTASIMASAGLAFAMVRMPPAGIFIILITVLGALTAIGWADLTFLALAAFITVALFGKTMAGWVTGTGESGG
jgi:hypothetical protein